MTVPRVQPTILVKRLPKTNKGCRQGGLLASNKTERWGEYVLSHWAVLKPAIINLLAIGEMVLSILCFKLFWLCMVQQNMYIQN